MNEAQIERLAIATEECGEVSQVVGKILRHGYNSYHPSDVDKTTNRQNLEKELGDILWIMDVMVREEDISMENILKFKQMKKEKSGKYLHHNNP